MKKSILIVIFVLIYYGLFCQENLPRQQKLSAETADWTSVISGKAICPPVKTSYGFVVLTDGKMISACSEAGVKLWERGVPGHPDPFLTVFSKDFLLSVSDKKNLSLINPSGLTLWTVKVPFVITDNPFVGRDSRIIVKGAKNIACYGVNGICKWILDTENLRNSSFCELNDGTILALLEKTENGKSSGIRFSPFGEILETINFTGLIQSSYSCPDGVLLTFTDGGAGMCSVIDGKTVTKWSIPYKDRAFSNTNPSFGSSFLTLSNHRALLLISGSGQVKTRALVFSTYDGRVSDWFNIDCNFGEIKCASVTNDSDSLFVSDKKDAFVHSTNGDILWRGLLPESSDIFGKWNFISFTKGNYLLICSTSWAMAAFRTTYKLTKKAVNKNKKPNYNDFYKIDSSFFVLNDMLDKIDDRFTGCESGRKEILCKGQYGSKEIEYTSAILSLLKDYNSSLVQFTSNTRPNQKSLYQRDQIGMQQVLTQLSLFGTDNFAPYISSLIRLEKDEANFQSLLTSVSSFGYDPDESIIKSIGLKAKTMSVSKNTELILICDSVYEICRFMGRPALYNYGMEILSAFLYPQYSSSVRDYARNTLTKIAALKI